MNTTNYSGNAWQGSKYEIAKDWTTAQTAKAIKKDLQKAFPGFKFSVVSDTYSGGCSIDARIISGYVPQYLTFSDADELTHAQRHETMYINGWLCNYFHNVESGRTTTEEEKQYFLTHIENPEFDEIVKKCKSIYNAYNYDDSDSMTDYFDTNYYGCCRVSDNYEHTPETAPKAKPTATAPTASEGGNLDGIAYTAEEDTDTRTGEPITVVKLAERVDRDEYKRIAEVMKGYGGYYSRFKGGFIFKTRPAFLDAEPVAADNTPGGESEGITTVEAVAEVQSVEEVEELDEAEDLDTESDTETEGGGVLPGYVDPATLNKGDMFILADLERDTTSTCIFEKFNPETKAIKCSVNPCAAVKVYHIGRRYQITKITFREPQPPTEPEKIELTETEKNFLDAEIEPVMAKSVLAWDEIEDLGYIFFEEGYIDRYSPSERAMYGNGVDEKDIYALADKMRNGEDVRADLTRALLGNQQTFTTKQDNAFHITYNKDDITATFGNAEKSISYEAVGDAFLKLFEGEYKEIIQALSPTPSEPENTAEVENLDPEKGEGGDSQKSEHEKFIERLQETEPTKAETIKEAAEYYKKALEESKIETWAVIVTANKYSDILTSAEILEAIESTDEDPEDPTDPQPTKPTEDSEPTEESPTEAPGEDMPSPSPTSSEENSTAPTIEPPEKVGGVVVHELPKNLIEQANNNSQFNRGDSSARSYEAYCEAVQSWDISDSKKQKILDKVYKKYLPILQNQAAWVPWTVAGPARYNAKKLDKGDKVMQLSAEFSDWFNGIKSGIQSKDSTGHDEKTERVIKNIGDCIANKDSEKIRLDWGGLCRKYLEELAALSQSEFVKWFEESNKAFKFRKSTTIYKLYVKASAGEQITAEKKELFSDENLTAYSDGGRVYIRFFSRPAQQLKFALKKHGYWWNSYRSEWSTYESRYNAEWVQGISTQYEKYI